MVVTETGPYGPSKAHSSRADQSLNERIECAASSLGCFGLPAFFEYLGEAHNTIRVDDSFLQIRLELEW